MKVFQEAAHLEGANRPFAIATITEAKGSTPRTRGRMLIRPDGTTTGSIGGGKMEQYVIAQALEALASGTSRTVQRDLVRDGERAVDMDCGGTMEVYIDVVGRTPELLLVGGGHVNQAIARVAALLDFDIVVVEDRIDFAAPERLEGVRRVYHNPVLADAVTDAVREGTFNEDAAVVVAPASDEIPVLKSILQMPFGYIGFLGSKRKVSRVLDALRKEGINDELLQRVYGPVGLDIGAETPEEIAVSVLAEILAVQRKKGGHSLRRLVDDLVIVRGGGDLATGVAWRLYRSGFPLVVLETPQPTVIRRTVSFAQAVYQGEITIEGIRAVRTERIEEVYSLLEEGAIPVLIDPELKSVGILKPAVVVDAIIAKKNIGMHRDLAPITVALGPGFCAGEDVDAVVETNRGHTLGRVILEGYADADTGVPGTIGGQSARRVVRAPGGGIFSSVVSIGDLVEEGQLLARVGTMEVRSPLTGLVRGLLSDGIEVTEGFKIGDVDPRGASVDWRTISDKARAIAGGVLEAILYLRNRR